ncbi:DUF2569 family protein, partial [Salmonella enterica]|uniref:DUF2569 family protein n=1 Tax=Salmonella enterica TaxID=28901 RepID=UPI0011616B79
FYTLWLKIAFFKRSRPLPMHYIIWLLVSALLTVLPLFSFDRLHLFLGPPLVLSTYGGAQPSYFL